MDFTRTGPTLQMHGWYLQDRTRAVIWTWAFPGTRLLREPEEKKGHRAWQALFRKHNSSSPESLPSAFHPPRPLVPGEGPLGARSWAGAGRGREGSDPLTAMGDPRITPHPPHAPLAPTQLVSPACAHKKHPEGALRWGRPQSTLQTLVGWEPPSPRGEEGGKGLRTARVGDKPQGPRPIPSSCGPQGKAPLFSQPEFQNGREGRSGRGREARVDAEAK